MRKAILLFLILIIVGIGIGVWLNKTGELATTTSLMQRENDFLLHLRVEEGEKGIKVLHSIQYLGEEDIKMLHKKPLVSISLNNNEHYFTGSTVSKNMKNGAIYHQEEVVFPLQNKGMRDLYIHAQFMLDGEEVNIQHVEELHFQ